MSVVQACFSVHSARRPRPGEEIDGRQRTGAQKKLGNSCCNWNQVDVGGLQWNRREEGHTLFLQSPSVFASGRSTYCPRQATNLAMAASRSRESAETTYQQALILRVQAQPTRYGDIVALFQALVGGWWNRKGEQNAG
jgi:hypothetical protein